MKASSRDPLVRYGPSCPPSEPLVAHSVRPAQFVTDRGVTRKRKDTMTCDGTALLPHVAVCDPSLTVGERVQTRRGINLLYLDRVVRRRRGTSRVAGLLAGLWIRRGRTCQNKSKSARASMQVPPPLLPLCKMRINSALV